ncbi:copper resistance protein CopC [Pseudonocardia sp. C8]|uniref:copper resistance CopC family protein n=1 Tax=Pseudonocardia sp. C8 TaxID=2762759 RepID=UPI001642360F|nr:copper resistance CopC family protein [Pseudonocardia sp. C8]MBC3194306.1 copper resistance protein CopC [Pseudonocardia sp. C8]
MSTSLRSRPCLRALAVTTALVAALLAGLLGAGPAQAHEDLVASDPPDGSSVTAAPTEIRLTFSGAVRPGTSTVAVTGPGGRRWEAGAASTAGDTVTVPLRRLAEAGTYTVGYRVVSGDGHPVTGSTTFILDVAPQEAPSTTPFPLPAPDSAAATVPPSPTTAHEPTATPATGPARTAAADAAAVPAWMFFALAAVVTLAATTTLARRRR